MHVKDAILHTYAANDRFLEAYLGDLDDADLLIRPFPGQNHIAWQLGHLILSERGMLESIKPGSSPALPANFEESHIRAATNVDDPAKYLGKDRYFELYRAQRAVTKKALSEIGDAELDATAPERMLRMCPNVGAVFNLIGNHVMLHVGQFVSVRRKLNKPVTI